MSPTGRLTFAQRAQPALKLNVTAKCRMFCDFFQNKTGGMTKRSSRWCCDLYVHCYGVRCNMTAVLIVGLITGQSGTSGNYSCGRGSVIDHQCAPQLKR